LFDPRTPRQRPSLDHQFLKRGYSTRYEAPSSYNHLITIVYFVEAADSLTFAQLFLNDGRADGRQVLKPETVKLVTQNAIGTLDVRLFKTAVPAYSKGAEFFPGMVKKWGLGFMISITAAPGGRSADSLAWAGLGNTYFWIDPAHGVAGVILMQVIPFADGKALALFGEFEKAVYAALS
jgi:methyl acetate hydrolase